MNPNQIKTLILSTLLGLGMLSVHAQTIRSWTGSTDNNWNNRQNWNLYSFSPFASGNQRAQFSSVSANVTVTNPITIASIEKYGSGSVSITGEKITFNQTLKAISSITGEHWSIWNPIEIPSGTLSVDPSGSNSGIRLRGVISGSGGIEVRGSGTVYLWANNTYTGGTTVNSGRLSIGALYVGGSVTGNISLLNSGRVSFDAGTVTYGGIISGNGYLIVDGWASAVTLTGNNTFAQQARVENGSLTVGDNGTNGEISSDVFVSGNGVFAFRRSDDITYNYVVSGSGNFIKNGSNMLTLLQNNSITGQTIVTGGTLRLGNNTTTGTVAGNIRIDNGARLQFNRSDDVIFTRNISGQGIFEKLSENTLTLTGNISHTGGTVVSAGTLRIGNNSTNGFLSGDVSLSANTGLQFHRSNNLTFAGDISGEGSLVKYGAGLLTLTGNSTHTAGTFVNEGTLKIGDNTSTGWVHGDITTSPGTQVHFHRSDYINLSGSITGDGSVVKLGAEVLVLSGNNIYTGETFVNEGTLFLNGAHTGGGAFHIASGAAFGGMGTISSDMTFSPGANFVFNPMTTLTVLDGKSVAMHDTFGISNLVNADGTLIDWNMIDDGVYTLISTLSGFNNISNFGFGNRQSIGDDRFAYFQNGSLQLVVIPEPSTILLTMILLGSALLLGRRSKHPRKNAN